MGGSIRCCPNCGEYVLPPAVQVVRLDGPPYQKAECVSCGWFGFTEDLRLKFIPTMLVGEAPPPPPQNTFFAIDGSATQVDGTNPLVTSPAFTPGADELVVACVCILKNGATLVVNSVTLGGVPMSLADELTHHQDTVYGGMWYLSGPAQVPSQVSVELGDPISGVAVSVLRFQGYHSLVHTSANDEDGSDFESNFTPLQPQTGLLLVGMNACNTNVESLVQPPTCFFGDDDSNLQVAVDASVGDDDGGSIFVGVFNSHRFLGESTGRFRYFGNVLATVDHVSIAAVFKP